jgi:hypothetical protein
LRAARRGAPVHCRTGAPKTVHARSHAHGPSKPFRETRHHPSHSAPGTRRIGSSPRRDVPDQPATGPSPSQCFAAPLVKLQRIAPSLRGTLTIRYGAPSFSSCRSIPALSQDMPWRGRHAATTCRFRPLGWATPHPRTPHPHFTAKLVEISTTSLSG